MDPSHAVAAAQPGIPALHNDCVAHGRRAILPSDPLRRHPGRSTLAADDAKHQGNPSMTFMSRLAAAFCLSVAAVGLPQVASANPGDCNAQASAPWAAAGSGYQAEALTHGKTCDMSVAVIIVRGPDGTPIFVSAHNARDVMVLAGMASAADMEAALKVWIDQSDGVLSTTGKLPEWAQGQDQPSLGEFPFMPEPEIDRETYATIRADNTPLFCFVQGMESVACAVLVPADGVMYKVGLQLFPG